MNIYDIQDNQHKVFPDGSEYFNVRKEMGKVAEKLISNHFSFKCDLHTFMHIDNNRTDNGDVVYIHKGKFNLVDVKWKDVYFDDKSPYPYPDVWVCQCYQFDDKDPKPDFFFIVSADLRYFIPINSVNASSWDRRLAEQKNLKGKPETWSYFAKRDSIKAKPISEYIRSMTIAEIKDERIFQRIQDADKHKATQNNKTDIRGL